jgi:transcriptional regulator with XRE-family HTH domain
LSQEALAKRIGVRQYAISRYESGRTAPHLTTLLKLAQALSVNVRYFFPEELFAHLPQEQQDTLSRVTSLSEPAMQFVLTFIDYFAQYQLRKRFVVEDVLSFSDPDMRLILFLKRDSEAFAENYQSQPLEALVSFTALLLMSVHLERVDEDTELLLQYFGANGQKLVKIVRRLIQGMEVA